MTESAGNAYAFYFNAYSTSSNVLNWNTDTGATSHMTPHWHWIQNYTPYRVHIILHVPALENNLLAVLYLTRQKSFEVHITWHSVEIELFYLQPQLIITMLVI